MTKPPFHLRLIVVVVLIVLAATGAYVFTASNNVPATNAGSGSGVNIDFESTVDGTSSGGQSLTTKTPTVTFTSAVGTTALASLTTEDAAGGSTGTTQINGGSITTTVDQDYKNAVLLGATTTLTSTTGGITFERAPFKLTAEMVFVGLTSWQRGSDCTAPW